MSLLIVDSGSTKADWRLLTAQSVKPFASHGLNPYFVTGEDMTHYLAKEVLPQIGDAGIEAVYFYGAGCGASGRKAQVASVLKGCFPNASVMVETDLLAAARALLKKEKGLAVILGTGTNSGLYDGQQIIESIDSLGYFLGDEGSGAAIGRKLLREYLRNYWDDTLQQAFANVLQLNREEILFHLYEQPFPNRFLASWVPFAQEHIAHPQIQQLVKESFREFFGHQLTHYPDFQKYPLCCTGSVAYFFEELLTLVAGEFSMQVKQIIRYPIDELVMYHRSMA